MVGDSWRPLAAMVKSLAVTLEGLSRRAPFVGVQEHPLAVEWRWMWCGKEAVPEIPRTIRGPEPPPRQGQGCAEGGGEFRRC